LTILAIASIAIGNVVAIAQTNIKRMLAYSTISHMGFLMLGVIAANSQGYAASMFYVLVYTLTSMSAFGLIILMVSKPNAPELIEDFSGLAKTRPWIGFVSMIIMFSLAGVPPFAGFWAKWFVLKELISAGGVFVAAVAVVFSLIGAYYYLRVIKIMYFDEPASGLDVPNHSVTIGEYVFTLNGAIIVFVGLFPGLLMYYCLSAMQLYGAG
jgi:NADH-quinone oxidoreductase subunit N